MPNFDRRSKFNASENFKSIVFGANSVLTEIDLNELQDIQRNNHKEIFKTIYQDNCILETSNTSIVYQNNTFTIQNIYAVVNNDLVKVSSLSIRASNNDSIYLKVKEKVVKINDNVYEEGNLQGNLLTNDLADDRFNGEISRRIQQQYDLSLVNTDISATYLKLGKIVNNSFVSEVKTIKTLAEEIKSINLRIQNLNPNLDSNEDLQSLNAAIQNLNSEIQTINTVIQNLDSSEEIQNLNDEIQNLDSEIELLNIATQGLNSTLQGLNSIIQDLDSREEIQNINTAIQDINAEIQDLDSKIQNLNPDLDSSAEIQNINAAIQNLNVAIQSINTEIQDLDTTEEIQELNGEIENLNDEIQNLNVAIQGLSSVIQDLDSSGEIQNINTEIQSINAAIQNLDSAMRDLDTSEEIQELNNEIQGLDSAVQSLDSAIQDLNSAIQDLDSSEDIQNINIEIQNINTEIQNLDSAIRNLNPNLDSSEEIQNINTAIQNLNSEIQDLNSAMQNLNTSEEIQELNEEIQDLDTEIQNLNVAIQILSSSIQNLDTSEEIQSLNTEIQNIQATIQNLNTSEEIQSLNVAIQNIQATIQNLDSSEEIENLNEEIQSINDAIQNLDSVIQKPKQNKLLENVCFFYGHPHRIDNVEDNEKAAQIFAKYDIVVWGDGKYDPTHSSYASSIIIAARMKELNPNIQLFGYVPIGPISGTPHLPMSEIYTRMDNWKTLGATGIFFDQFGYDYLVTRERQNACIQGARDRGMNVFVNAWQQRYVFSNDSIVLPWKDNFDGNPNRIPSIIGENDYTLFENILYKYESNDVDGVRVYYQSIQDHERMEHMLEYSQTPQTGFNGKTWREHYKTKAIGLDSIVFENEEMFKEGYLLALACGLDGYAPSTASWGSASTRREFPKYDDILFDAKDLSEVGTAVLESHGGVANSRLTNTVGNRTINVIWKNTLEGIDCNGEIPEGVVLSVTLDGEEPSYGKTWKRPANPRVGFQYFDTDLKENYIYKGDGIWDKVPFSNELQTVQNDIENLRDQIQIPQQKNKLLENVCFYYGTPHRIDNVDDNEKAAKIFAQFDVVVWSENTANPTGNNYARSKAVLTRMKELNPNIQLFGYIPIGIISEGSNLPMSEIHTRMDNWKIFGATGIFLDEFGYDYLVTRERQNACIQACRDRGMNAFANSWEQKYVFSNDSMPISWRDNFDGNPNRIPAIIGENDYTLFEEMLFKYGTGTVNGTSVFTQRIQEHKRMESMLEYTQKPQTGFNGKTWREHYKTKAIGLDSIVFENEEMFKQGYLLALACGLDGYAPSTASWGSSSTRREFPKYDDILFDAKDMSEVGTAVLESHGGVANSRLTNTVGNRTINVIWKNTNDNLLYTDEKPEGFALSVTLDGEEPSYGETWKRPANPRVGFQYFDTDLKENYIYKGNGIWDKVPFSNELQTIQRDVEVLKGVQKNKLLENVCIFLGTPYKINNLDDDEKAAKVFAQFDVVVWGEGIESPANGNNGRFKAILTRMKQLNPNIQLFGTVIVGNTSGNPSMSEIQQKISDWKTFGATGIFLDNFGYDYLVTRERQNECIQATRDRGMNIIADVSEKRHIFSNDSIYSSSRNFDGNPNRIPSIIGENDYVLFEDTVFRSRYNTVDGTRVYYQSIQKHASRITAMLEYSQTPQADFNGKTWREHYGTKAIGSDTIVFENEEVFKQGYLLALACGLDAYSSLIISNGTNSFYREYPKYDDILFDAKDLSEVGVPVLGSHGGVANSRLTNTVGNRTINVIWKNTLDYLNYNGEIPEGVALSVTLDGEEPSYSKIWKRPANPRVGFQYYATDLSENYIYKGNDIWEKMPFVNEVQTTQNNINSLRDEVEDVADSLNSNISSLTGRVDTLETTVANLPTGGGGTTDLTAVNTRIDSVQLVTNDVDTVKKYGVVGNGTTNDSTTIQAMIDQLRASSVASKFRKQHTIIIPSGRYVLNSPLKMPPYMKLKPMGNVEFHVTHGGTGLWIAPESTDINNVDGSLHQGQGSWTRGELIDGSNGSLVFTTPNFNSTATAIELGSRTTAINEYTPVSRYVINNITIMGFNIGIKMNASNNYIGTFKHVFIEFCNHAVVFEPVDNVNDNSGENFVFDNCIIGNNRNTAIVFNVEGMDVTFMNCSFDFNASPVMKVTQCGINVRLNNSYVEMIGSGALGTDQLLFSVDADMPWPIDLRNSLYISNTIMYLERPSVIINNKINPTYNQYMQLFVDFDTLELRYKGTSGGVHPDPYNLANRYLIDGGQLNIFGHKIINTNPLFGISVHNSLNVLSNGNLEYSTVGTDLTNDNDPYWAVEDSSGISSPTIVAEGINNSKCIKFNITNASSNSVTFIHKAKIPVEPGEVLYASAVFKADKLRNNQNFSLGIFCFDFTGRQVGDVEYFDFISSGDSTIQNITAEYRLLRGTAKLIVPKDTVSVQFYFYAQNLKSTYFCLDEIHVFKSK